MPQRIIDGLISNIKLIIVTALAWLGKAVPELIEEFINNITIINETVQFIAGVLTILLTLITTIKVIKDIKRKPKKS